MTPIYGKFHLQWPIHHNVWSVPTSVCTFHSGSILHPLPPRIARFPPSREEPIERGGLCISASRSRLEWNGIGLDCRKKNTIVPKSLEFDTNNADEMKIRKIVEHVFLLKMKADLSEEEESDMLDFLYTSQYHMNSILAISLGRIAEPDANGYTHAVYMRFQKKEDLAKFYNNSYYLGVIKDHVSPHCYGSISVDYESQVQDDILAIFRRGEDFNSGVEFVLLISVLQGAVGDAIEDAMITFHRLTHELKPLIVQKTQGSNFNETDNDEFTHCAIIRFLSVEALEIFRNCSEFKDMWKYKFHPIIKKSLAIHFSVDPIGMLMGHVFGSYDQNNFKQILLEDVIFEADEEETDLSGKILYNASFEELSRNHVQYDTIIWVLISVLLILAWGVGVLILLYIPIRRYILQKDISSRKLYINSQEIVYKGAQILRSIYHFILLSMSLLNKVISIGNGLVLGCLQALYRIHTFRVEGMTRPVDELQIQGVSNPDLLRKMIILEAAKNIQEIGMQKSKTYSDNAECFQSPKSKNHVCTAHSGFLLQKVEEIRLSMKICIF